eukprot:GHVU01120093.1.p1 GENE.GHVU01120093.1~~GHVU01120093.1.p1  ORF type:complete len:286 (+),score=17.64 GHVU01120093.1:98-955(+)
MTFSRTLNIAMVLALTSTTVKSQDLTAIIGSLSSSCQSAAAGLMTTEFGTCANIMSFIPIIGAPGSIISPFSDWVSSSCPLAPCSNSTLTAALSSVSTGCASDITKGVPIAIALSSIIANYVPIREMACAQYASNSSFCAEALFTNIEQATKKNVTISVLENTLTQGFSTLIPLLAAVPKEDYCNDCGKELYILTSQIKPTGQSSSDAASASAKNDVLVSSICGAPFVNGTPPSTVRQAASSNTTTNLSGTNAQPDTSYNSGSQLKPSFFASISLVLVAYMSVSA